MVLYGGNSAASVASIADAYKQPLDHIGYWSTLAIPSPHYGRAFKHHELCWQDKRHTKGEQKPDNRGQSRTNDRDNYLRFMSGQSTDPGASLGNIESKQHTLNLE